MDDSQLSKLRRFALIIAVVLITYSVALTDLDFSKMTVLGMSLNITSSHLPVIGLVLTSLYALVRYWIYGMTIATSPYFMRKQKLAAGPRTDPISTLDEEENELLKLDLHWRFLDAKLFTAPNIHKSNEHEVDSIIEFVKRELPHTSGAFEPIFEKRLDGQGTSIQLVHIRIPLSTQAAIALEQLDYTSPIWLNGIGLTSFGWKVLSDLLSR